MVADKATHSSAIETDAPESAAANEAPENASADDVRAEDNAVGDA